eukprot:976479_1
MIKTMRRFTLDDKDDVEYFADCEAFIGNCYHELGQYKKANAQFLKALELTPTNAEYYIEYGQFLKDLGYIEQAKIYFEKALNIDPTDDEACYSLAILFRDDLNDYDGSERYYLKAIALGRECHGSYAYLLYLMKDYKKALHHMQIGLAETANVTVDVDFWDHLYLGIIRKALGATSEKVIQSLENAVKAIDILDQDIVTDLNYFRKRHPEFTDYFDTFWRLLHQKCL